MSVLETFLSNTAISHADNIIALTMDFKVRKLTQQCRRVLIRDSSVTHLGGHGTMIVHWPLEFGTKWQQLHCIPHRHSTSVHNQMFSLSLYQGVYGAVT